MHTRARPHVHHEVGRADHVLVMLHHQHAVADIAQMLQRADQAVVVALVQADAGLVQHVHHAGQATADLAGQADALGLAAAERFGAALQTQVVQADIVQEFQARGNLAHHLVGDLGLGALQRELLEIALRLAQSGVADFVDGALVLAFADQHMTRFLAQAGAVAARAGLHAAVACQILAHHAGIGVAVAPLHVGQNAFEGMAFFDRLALARAAFHHVAKGDLVLARAVQHHITHRLRQLLERGFHIHTVVLADAFQQRKIVAIAPVPALDGAAGQAERGKGHYAVGVEHIHAADTIARRAGTHRRVEGKQARFQFGNAVAAYRAGVLGVEEVLLPVVHLQHQRAPFGQTQRGLETLRQTLARIGAHLQAVDHHVDIVLLVLGQRRRILAIHGLAVDAEADVAQRLHLRQQIGKLALLAARHRRQQHHARFGRQRQHGIDHLAHGLCLQRQMVIRAMGCAGAGKQQAQVVVDFRHRAHGGARVVAGGFLLDADRGRQALDQVHIRLVHQLQELARIGGQALHIAPLPLGIQRVESQAGLARAAQAGDHHQLVARNVQVDVLEVVRTRATNADVRVGAGALRNFGCGFRHERAARCGARGTLHDSAGV